MANTGAMSIISSSIGLLLFVISGWFLKTVDITELRYNPNDPNWASNRRHLLLWGTAASIGTSVGIFQFAFSLVYTLHSVKEQQSGERIWNLGSVILHSIFLISILSGLGVSFNAAMKSQVELVGSLRIVFIIFEIVETVFLIAFLLVFEREFGYVDNIMKIFSCEEFKDHLASISRWRFPWQNQRSLRRERLVEETSIPI